MSWRVLPLTGASGAKLLLKAEFNQDGYRVELTDMSSVWKEELKIDDVFQQASDCRSSIDPSEDDEQLSILYDKIKSALNCEQGTSLRLKSDDLTTIEMEIEAPLPHPLAPFKWTFNLKRGGTWGSDLITPFIVQANSLQRKMEQLIGQLHDKDRVISKICDRLETSGNDLTAVFPGASHVKISRKKSQREQLAKHVKGLEDFDEVAWRRQHRQEAYGATLSDETINEVFADLPAPSQSSNDEDVISLSEMFRPETRDDHGPCVLAEHVATVAEKNVEKDGRKHTEDQRADSMQTDQFQRQETPPLPKSFHSTQRSSQENSRNGNEIAQTDGDSTTDEEDLDVLPSSERPVWQRKPPEKATPTRARKLGKLGGQETQISPSPEHSSVRDDLNPSAHRAKLGAIGGKAQRTGSHNEHINKSVDATKDSSPARKSKLGAIGGKGAQSTKAASPAPTEPVSAPQAVDASPYRGLASERRSKTKSPEPSETAEEMADRKRDQLKRDLEQRAKVPAKKKRKF